MRKRNAPARNVTNVVILAPKQTESIGLLGVKTPLQNLALLLKWPVEGERLKTKNVNKLLACLVESQGAANLVAEGDNKEAKRRRAHTLQWLSDGKLQLEAKQGLCMLIRSLKFSTYKERAGKAFINCNKDCDFIHLTAEINLLLYHELIKEDPVV